MSLKILSFNACLLPPFLKNAGSDNDYKRERIDLFFEKYTDKYDILLLQEVWETIWSCSCNNIFEYTKNKGIEYGFNYQAFTKRKFYNICNNGLLILSKFPIKNSYSHIYKNSSGFQWFVPNGVIYCEIETPIKNLDFYVTHIHAGPLDSSFRNSKEISLNVQEGQIKELIEFIDQTNKNEFIIGGDFNSDAINKSLSSNSLLPYQKLKEMIGRESLLNKINYPNTYPIPKKGSFLVNSKFKDEETCVDHIFTNIEKIEISVKELKIKEFYLSDHAGIELKVKLD